MVAIDISRTEGGAVPTHPQYLQAVRRRSRHQSMQVVLCQIGILAVVLGAWEFLTRIPWFAENTIYDPFFISQPSKIIARIGEWMVPGPYSIWPNLWSTLSATFLGLCRRGQRLRGGPGAGSEQIPGEGAQPVYRDPELDAAHRLRASDQR